MTHSIGVFASIFDEIGRMVLVRQSYAGQCWTQPGGRLEVDEDPIEGVLREIYEETNIRAEIVGFVGTYVSPHKNDVVLHFRGAVRSQDDWKASDEILECACFWERNLPTPMRPNTLVRLRDGFSGATGLFKVMSEGGQASSL
jgi:8-oxo-dGTP diphosphatase